MNVIKRITFIAVAIVACSFALMITAGMVAPWYTVAALSFVQSMQVVGLFTGVALAMSIPVGLVQRLLGIK